MDRRQFLKAGSFLTASAATLGLTGCFGRGGGGGGEPARSYTFPQGVASGDPQPASLVLWTRLGDAVADTPVTIEIATSQSFASILHSVTVTAQAQWDYTVRHKVTALQPGTTYYYRFRAGSGVSQVGRSKTAPAAGTPVSQLKFAFISCQDWSVNHWAAFDELLQQDLDFVVHLGDYIYETVGAAFQTGKVETRHSQITLPDGVKRSDGATYANTLADYRTLYKTYRSDSRLQALHAAFPIIAVWDDHEFSDDAWQDRQNYTTGEDAAKATSRRRDANQAWFEYMPADVSLDAANPSFQNIQIYRQFSFGNLATLVMTDQRLYRADHVIPELGAGSEIGSRYFVPKSTLAAVEGQKMSAASGSLDPVSILGSTQRQWWKDQMSAANTTWKLWGNEVSLLRMQVDGTQAVAGLMLQGLIAANAGLAALQNQLMNALVSDLTTAAAAVPSASKATQTPAPAYTQTKAVLALAGVSAPVFDAGIKPQLDAALPAAQFFDVFLLNADQWDGYNAERKALMKHLKDNAIGNVVALTGDIHAFFAGSVMDDYDAASPVPVMVDLVTAGVSSNSFYSYFESVVDSSASFGKTKPLIYTEQNGVRTNTFNSTLTTFNPWLKVANTDAQGYALVTLTPAKLSCSFHTLKTLSAGVAPAQPATRSTSRLEVVAGSPSVTVLP